MALGRRPVPEGRLRRSAGAALAIVVLGAVGAVLPAVPAHAAAEPAPLLYITNFGYGTVTALDPATGSTVASIPVDGGPQNVAVTPDGKQVWVSGRFVHNISVIDTTTNTVTGTVELGAGHTPMPVVFSPDGAHAYVTYQEGGVEVVDTATGTVTATLATGADPAGVAISPDGGRLYVTSSRNNTVSVVDTASDTVTATVPVQNVQRLAVSPDGAHVYATSKRNTLSVIDTATATVTATVTVGVFPQGVAVTPDGNYVYTANETNSVSVVDTATNTVVATIPTKKWSYAIAISPDGAHAYISSPSAGVMTTLDTATNTVAATAPAGYGGYDIALDAPVPPAVTGLAPDHGPTTGGTTVTLTGSHLYGTTGVSFDGAPAGSFTVVNDTTVTATAPAHAAGTANVSLTARGRTATAGAYTYQAPAPVVTGVAPAQGPLAGGNTVTITGSNFTGATAVTFGSTPAAAFTVDTDTRITATAPAASGVGAVGVTVTTPGGTSTAAQYGYVYPFSGFQAPVANPPAVNAIKAGRAVPIQFGLGGDRGLGVLATGQPTVQQTDCTTGAAIGSPVPAQTAGNSTLQYDPASGTYTYVWKTDKAWSGTCRTFTLGLNDGTTHTALFQLR
ncbi:PxKF domain-containing protein [Kitasatospora sp. NPDC098652]|uniref:PxKF domain-containing protein n=1 Tax=Kitasatospora sp. NPDC098652 TaxID=3364095 RepID=UPI00380861AD